VAPVDVIGLTAACSEGIASGWFTDQGCGWSVAADESCTPGELISLECVFCDGAPDMRVCDGSEVCVPYSPREIGRGFGFSDSCPAATFDCPASGHYSAWVTPFEEAESDVCTLLPTP
jgi:hypothetical protein